MLRRPLLVCAAQLACCMLLQRLRSPALARHLARSASTSADATPLLTLRAARLAFASDDDVSATTPPLDLSISAAGSGGHALLGANGSGKTLLSEAIGASASDLRHLRSGELVRRDGWTDRSVSLVSFESHQELLAAGGTVYASLSRGGTLSAAARYLVVRFGLHPLLYRPVSAISTGEIRKVLLARALSRRPQLLVLDNAFDGLDVPSRTNLAELISHTLRGFGQLLVQGVDARATAHTQVSTHGAPLAPRASQTTAPPPATLTTHAGS
eukprot:5311722-Prymnesium_polylepis.1